MAIIRVGGAALNQSPIDWDGNLARIRQALDEARERKIQILCLPELCITGYGCEDLFLSEWVPKKAFEHMLELVPDTKGLVTILGFPYRLKGKLYNMEAFCVDGEVKGITCKKFLANEGVHYEPRWFTAWPKGEQIIFEDGDLYVPCGDVIHEALGYKIGIEICEDAWVGESRPAYDFAKKGVRIILNPSASHFGFGKTHVRDALVEKGSLIIDGVYCYTNLLGNESGKTIFDGEIMIAQDGEMRQLNDRLSFKDVNVTHLDMDVEDPTNTQQVDLSRYSDTKEVEFHEAVTLGMFDYMRKSRSNGFVLSLSGGADSSAIAIMVATMVERGLKELGIVRFCEKANMDYPKEWDGLEQNEQQKRLMGKLLITAYQGTKNSSKETRESAKMLAESIGATFYEWEIDDEVSGYTSTVEEVLGRKLDWENDDIALQNIQARSRSPIIWMFANIDNKLLLSTSNRSEADVGYATMDGDTSGSISPIAGVDKHFVLSYLRYAERELGYAGLRYVNALKPTAELRPGEMKQTDEDDLMPYFVIKSIERAAIHDRLSPMQVFQYLYDQDLEPGLLLKQHVIKFFRMWSRNQWKRERYAPAFHLDDFSVDPRTWCRFPILSSGFHEELRELEALEI